MKLAFVHYLAVQPGHQLIRPCHTAAILSRETKKALFYHAKPHPHSFHCEAWRCRTKLFGLPGQYGRRVTRANGVVPKTDRLCKGKWKSNGEILHRVSVKRKTDGSLDSRNCSKYVNSRQQNEPKSNSLTFAVYPKRDGKSQMLTKLIL